MRLRKAVLIGTTMSLLALGAPNANATIFTGACAMSLSFSFDSPVTAIPHAVGYSVAGGTARTINQVTEGCVVDTNALSFLRTTSASGEGVAPAWSCGAVAGLGTWQQSWEPDPAPMSGTHAITGTWGDWTMAITSSSLNFTGEMELTVDPLDAGKLTQCTSNGITGLRMIGVMHFQDPSL